MDAFISLLNAASDKLAFLGGLALVLVCVFCKSQVQLGQVRLPAIDGLGRGISGVIGIALVSWAVFAWTASATVGLFSTPPGPTRGATEQGRSFVRSAYAAAGQRVVLRQDRPQRARLPSGAEVGLFAFDISARSPSRFVVFEVTGNARSLLDRDTTYTTLVRKVGRGHFLLDTAVEQGRKYSFALGSRTHTVAVSRVLWYAFGPDYIVVELT